MVLYDKIKEKHGKPKPILFNSEMVRAILDGRKTQTSQIVKPQPKWQSEIKLWQWENIAWANGDNPKIPFHQKQNKFPYGPGDILYVRETFYPCKHFFVDGERQHFYKASMNEKEMEIFNNNDWNWKPSIHMPKEATRIFLKVTDVRVERLQEISEEDARAEGIANYAAKSNGEKFFENMIDVREAFKDLWDSINEKRGYGWENNPFVWVIEFEVLKNEKM